MTIDISKTERAMIIAALMLAEKISIDAAKDALCDGKISSYYDLIDYTHDLCILQDRLCSGDEL